MGWRDDPLAQPGPVSRPAPVARPRNAEPSAPRAPAGPAWASDPIATPAAPASTVAAPQTEQPLSWADVPGKAIENAPASAVKFAQGIAQPFLHPIDTGKAIFDVGYGLASKLHGAVGGTQDPEQKAKDEAAANAVGEHFKGRYGSMEGFKKALAEDPVGVIADVSVVLTGGGAALSRGPGVVAKAGEVASAAGNAIDPLMNAGRAVKAAGTGAANVLGVTTGAGTRPFQEAFTAGRQGNQALPDNMRGKVPQDDAIALAENAVAEMGKKRSADYQAGMTTTNAATNFVNTTPVFKIINDARKMAFHQGIPKSADAAKVVQSIDDIVYEFSNLSGKPTPERFDAMKQAVGEIRQKTQQGTLERRIADSVYHGIKSEIVKQVPEYAKTMKDYQAASESINEARRALSVNDRATADTTMRKLQSTMRDGVATNYGQRGRVLDELAQYEPGLPAALAGQNLNSWAPRGLARMVGSPVAAGAAYMQNPLGLAALPLASPRLMGELAYGAGRGAGAIDAAASRLGMTPNMLLAALRSGYVMNETAEPAQNALMAGYR